MDDKDNNSSFPQPTPLRSRLRTPDSTYEELRGHPDPLKKKHPESDEKETKVDIDLSQSSSVFIRRKKKRGGHTSI